MKVALIALLCLFACFGVNAQSQFTPTADTSTNVQTKYIYSAGLPNSNGELSIQYVAGKVTGTVAGTVRLEGTVDGVNYIAEADTLALADQAINTKIWDITGKKRIKWRISVTTSGTVKLTNKAFLTERK